MGISRRNVCFTTARFLLGIVPAWSKFSQLAKTIVDCLFFFFLAVQVKHKTFCGFWMMNHRGNSGGERMNNFSKTGAEPKKVNFASKRQTNLKRSSFSKSALLVLLILQIVQNQERMVFGPNTVLARRLAPKKNKTKQKKQNIFKKTTKYVYILTDLGLKTAKKVHFD